LFLEYGGALTNILMLDCGAGAGAVADWVLKKKGRLPVIHVPNPDPAVVASLTKTNDAWIKKKVRCPPGGPIRAYPMRASNLLSRDGSYTDVWLDYCSTYDGTAGHYPRHDLRRLWQHGLDRTVAAVTVAATFSRRNGQTPPKKVVKEQVETAKLYGWNAKPLEVVHFGNMFLVVWVAKPVNAKRADAPTRYAGMTTRRRAACRRGTRQRGTLG
jgi:hypothetical protein